MSWHVDPDNPAWADVRAAAIAAAIEKGHDYAAALRGTLLRVEQVADTGLLGGSEPPGRMRALAAGASRGSSESFGPGAPSLDPEPQEVSAVIEARLIAAIAPVAPRSS
ncbi:SIMPL domain-containing protein [Jatrophihabitans sp.]|uniref:SIMPL domain-containing protein n=1 Tax=Jatrophihabitans sp. TaxID=1932789 RepID=UPI0030C726BC|nr:hypothetical protein [Jatrophihabitans sp.]